MSNDAVQVLKCLFQTIWSLFNSWNIPGTNVTPAVMALFLGAAGIGFKFVLRFLGSEGSFSSGMRGRNQIVAYHKRGTGRSVD